MKKPSSVKRIAVEAAALLILHAVLLQAMESGRVIEKVLAPGQHQAMMAMAAFGFLLLRTVLLVFAPGWFAVRLYSALGQRAQPESQNLQ